MGSDDRGETPEPDVPEAPVDSTDRDRILVPVFDESAAESVIPVGVALACTARADLVFVDLNTTEERTPYTVDDRSVATTSRPGVRLVQQCSAAEPSAEVWTTIQEGKTAVDAVGEAVRGFDASMVVLAVAPGEWSTAERVVGRVDCRTVATTATRGEPPESVLLVHAGRAAQEAADTVGRGVATYHDADLERVELDSRNELSTVVERTRAHDVTVVGATRRGPLVRRLVGDVEQALRENAHGDVLAVRPRSGHKPWLRRFLDRV